MINDQMIGQMSCRTQCHEQRGQTGILTHEGDNANRLALAINAICVSHAQSHCHHDVLMAHSRQPSLSLEALF